MSTADYDRDRWGLCLHEAAHAVAAWTLGYRVESCAVDPEPETVVAGDLTPAHSRTVAWAGAFAQTVWHEGDNTPSHQAVFTHASEPDIRLMGTRMPERLPGDIRFAAPAIRRLAQRLYRWGYTDDCGVALAMGVRPGVPLSVVRHAYAHRQPVPSQVGGAAA